MNSREFVERNSPRFSLPAVSRAVTSARKTLDLPSLLGPIKTVSESRIGSFVVLTNAAIKLRTAKEKLVSYQSTLHVLCRPEPTRGHIPSSGTCSQPSQNSASHRRNLSQRPISKQCCGCSELYGMAGQAGPDLAHTNLLVIFVYLFPYLGREICAHNCALPVPNSSKSRQ